MHTEKQKIFDRYARNVGFENWKGLLVFTRTFKADKLQNHIFAACDLVQKAQQERIAEKIPKDGGLLHNGATKDMIMSENNLIK
ncbi:hypothetical protein [Chryseobacterium taichungense]|uniref:hypothetical protein n=1 Tax=Chryseobacterium taichungense TaxID=295069 RepID=UPI0028A9FDE5|nr:hypothetical protein [Chryseobacterium taichungense]